MPEQVRSAERPSEPQANGLTDLLGEPEITLDTKPSEPMRQWLLKPPQPIASGMLAEWEPAARPGLPRTAKWPM